MISNERDKEFVRITNKDIYDMILKNQETNTDQHNNIIARLDTTNGKVKLAKWIASTALVISLMVLGYLISHLATSSGK